MAETETSGRRRLGSASGINIKRIGGLMLAAAVTVAGLAGVGAAALGLSGAVVGLSPIATASDATIGPAMPPGFCTAPAAFESAGALRVREGERSLVSFVSCRELEQWRRGERDRFEVAGAVALRSGEGRAAQAVVTTRSGAADDPSLLASLVGESDAATVTRIMTVAARMAEAGVESADLGRSVDDEVVYAATLLRAAGDGGAKALQLRMSAEPVDRSGPSTRREMIMPFESGDTLRYMRALLRAGLAADGITQVASVDALAGDRLASE